jgi:hypothetical protein
MGASPGAASGRCIVRSAAPRRSADWQGNDLRLLPHVFVKDFSAESNFLADAPLVDHAALV